MDLPAGYRRVERTDQAHILGAAVQGMTIVVVEGVQSAIGDLVYFASGQILDLAVTANAVNRFQVMLCLLYTSPSPRD